MSSAELEFKLQLLEARNEELNDQLRRQDNYAKELMLEYKVLRFGIAKRCVLKGMMQDLQRENQQLINGIQTYPVLESPQSSGSAARVASLETELQSTKVALREALAAKDALDKQFKQFHFTLANMSQSAPRSENVDLLQHELAAARKRAASAEQENEILKAQLDEAHVRTVRLEEQYEEATKLLGLTKERLACEMASLEEAVERSTIANAQRASLSYQVDELRTALRWYKQQSGLEYVYPLPEADSAGIVDALDCAGHGGGTKTSPVQPTPKQSTSTSKSIRRFLGGWWSSSQPGSASQSAQPQPCSDSSIGEGSGSSRTPVRGGSGGTGGAGESMRQAHRSVDVDSAGVVRRGRKGGTDGGTDAGVGVSAAAAPSIQRKWAASGCTVTPIPRPDEGEGAIEGVDSEQKVVTPAASAGQRYAQGGKGYDTPDPSLGSPKS